MNGIFEYIHTDIYIGNDKKNKIHINVAEIFLVIVFSINSKCLFSIDLNKRALSI